MQFDSPPKHIAFTFNSTIAENEWKQIETEALALQLRNIFTQPRPTNIRKYRARRPNINLCKTMRN